MIGTAARVRAAALLVVGVGAVACSAAPNAVPTGPTPSAATTAAPAEGYGGPLDPQDQQVLDRLPACPEAPTDQGIDVPEGVVLPPQAVVTERLDDGPLTQLQAWVPMDPVRVRRFYQQGVLGRAKPVQVEDEVIEAEALLEFPGGRFYVKAQAVCPTASVLTVVASTGNDAVPTPTGSATGSATEPSG